MKVADNKVTVHGGKHRELMFAMYVEKKTESRTLRLTLNPII